MSWIKRVLEFFSFNFAPASSMVKSRRAEATKVLSLLEDYFAASGGIAKVLKRFESAGFAGKVHSWLSGGPNLTINSVEALQLIGWKDLRQMSEKADIPVDRLRDLLAELLPDAVNKTHA